MRALLLCMLVGFTAGGICPPAEAIYPCTCSDTYGYRQINCGNIRGDTNLKEIFDSAAAAACLNDSVMFDSLHIFGTDVVEIKENTFEHFAFKQIMFQSNDQLEYISPLAFRASRNVTTDLYLYGVTNGSPHDEELLELIRNFPILHTVGLSNNKISSIPDHAFRNLPFLNQIYLDGNQISQIGSHAFATGGSNLKMVILRGNNIPSAGLNVAAFKGISSNLSLDLESNNMDFMDQRSFQPLFEIAEHVAVGGVWWSWDGYNSTLHNERLHCDDRADWICDYIKWSRVRLDGYFCKPEEGAMQIWDYCAARFDREREEKTRYKLPMTLGNTTISIDTAATSNVTLKLDWIRAEPAVGSNDNNK